MEKWNEVEIVRFLDFFEAKPCLWNPDVPEYRSPDKRSEAIRWIIQKMGLKITEMEIRCKIKNIRSTYLKCLKRVIRAREVGLGEEYLPTLLWYNKADSFMREHIMRTMHKKEQRRKEQSIYKTRLSGRSSKDEQDLQDSDDDTEVATAEFEQNDNDDETMTANNSSRDNGTTKTLANLLPSQKNDAMEATESEEDLTDLRKSNNPIHQSSRNHSNSSRNFGQNGSYVNHGSHTSSTVQQGSSYASQTSGGQHGPVEDHPKRKRMRPSFSQDSQQETDEFDIFSRHVGNQLRMLPLERALKCQDAIHSLLMRERIKTCQQLTMSSKIGPAMVRPVQYNACSLGTTDNNTCAKEPQIVDLQSSGFGQNQQLFDSYSYALKVNGE